MASHNGVVKYQMLYCTTMIPKWEFEMTKAMFLLLSDTALLYKVKQQHAQ